MACQCLPRLLPLLVLCLYHQTFVSGAALQSVEAVGPSQPICAIAGGETHFSCHLNPPISAVEMEIFWRTENKIYLVHLYDNGIEYDDKPDKKYKGRTKMIKEDIANGRVGVSITNITRSDAGWYMCGFLSPTQNIETFAKVELKVAGASACDLQKERDELIQVRDNLQKEKDELIKVKDKLQKEKDELIRVKDNLQKDKDTLMKDKGDLIKSRDNLQKEKDTLMKDKDILQKEKHTLMMDKGDLIKSRDNLQKEKGDLMKSRDILQKEKDDLIKSRDDLQKEKDTLMKNKDTLLKVKDYLINAIDTLQNDKETLQNDKDTLQNDKDILQQYRDAPVNEKDWKWARTFAAEVTLDPDTAHRWLIVSEDGRSVWLGDRDVVLPDTPQRFSHNIIILGKKRLSSGRHYWEVEVGDKTGWILGVCDASVRRKMANTLTPQNGYWTVRLSNGEYIVNTSPPTLRKPAVLPRTVGLLLDYEADRLWLFNVDDRSVLFLSSSSLTFPPTLRPFFSPGRNDGGINAGALRILPVTRVVTWPVFYPHHQYFNVPTIINRQYIYP